MPGDVDETKERERIAAELRRIRDEVRDRALLEPQVGGRLPEPLTPRAPQPVAAEPEPPPAEPGARPDNAALNELWRVVPPPSRNPLARLLSRALGPLLDRQQAFNARQVQFDNELFAYFETRLGDAQRHYDAVLGIHRRHMAEIDERHLILQEELVAHVHDLVKRIDLVLAGAERGRLSLEFALRDVRGRLAALEERLARS